MLSLSDRRVLAERMKPIVNTCRERVENNGCFSPANYSHYLDIKPIVDDTPAIHKKRENIRIYHKVKRDFTQEVTRESVAIKRRFKSHTMDFGCRLRPKRYDGGIPVLTGQKHRRFGYAMAGNTQDK